MRKLALSALLMSFVVLTGFGAVTNAQSPNNNGSGYRVSPVREEKTIERGTSIVTKIYVENTTSNPVETKAVINNFVADGETGEPKVDVENKLEISNDFRKIVGPIPNFNLNPKERKEIPVTLTVPKDSSPGGYYGAIRFLPASTSTEDAKVNLSASVGTIFLINVPGNLTEKLSLADFSVTNNGKQGFLFVNATNGLATTIKLQNTGNIHLKPFGKVQITKSGKVVEEFEFNDQQSGSGNVLPGQTRAFEHKFKNDKWFGKYTISANLSYGDGGDLITANKTFWVIPTWLAVLSIVTLAALVFGSIYFFAKKSNKGKKSVHKRR